MATMTKTKRKPKLGIDNAVQDVRLEKMEKAVDRIENRVFNGLGKELHKEISGVRNLVVGVLVSILLGLAGIVIEGRINTNNRSEENKQNYEAVLKIESKILELHGETGRIP